MACSLQCGPSMLRLNALSTLGAVLLITGCGSAPVQHVSTAEPDPALPGTSDAGANVADSEAFGDAGLVPDAAPQIVNQIAGVVVSTLAGSSIPGSQDGSGASAGFNNPVGLALHADGSLLVTEYGGSRVRKVLPDGATSSFASPSGFVGAFALVLAPSGQLFVQTDFDNTGSKTDSSGTLWTAPVVGGALSTMATGLGRPRGLAMLAADTIVVTDRMRHTVSLLRPSTPIPVLLAGASGVPGAINGAGSMARFSSPLGVVVMSDKSILVADSGNHCIRRIQADGTVSTFAGTGDLGMTDGPSATARFDLPLAIAIDDAGIVYVSDGGSSHRIRRIKNGLVETVAGTGTIGFADGPGGSAQFHGQEGLAVRSDGRVLYVADGNLGDEGGFHRIRKIAMP